MGIIDIAVFLGFIAAVVAVGMVKSKGVGADASKGADDYFLAGRGLKWWLVGFSLIAANISAEQFVGMSGQAAGVEGLATASWEWIASIVLVVAAFVVLPYFLRSGITTIPEFLEIRYNHWARLLVTISMTAILVVASLIGVTYAGSLVMHQLFESFGWNVPFGGCCLAMGVLAGGYVLFGGLKACAWADLLQGSALILGGGIIAYFAIRAFGSADPAQLAGAGGATTSATDIMARFSDLNAPKLHMGRPADDPALPWTVFLLGMWIPHFYYWSLNQYITQRVLGSGSLAEGQKGIVFAAALKLLIPFLIVVPGLLAFNLFSKEMGFGTPDFKPDGALGLLVTRLLPRGTGVMGFVLAALLGAIVSSLAAVLNAISTLLTMDVYRRYFRPKASARQLVAFGRWATVALMVAGVAVASGLKADSIFTYIQKMQLYVSPGVVAVFIFGLVNRRGARWIGAAALVLSPSLFAAFSFGWPSLHYLHAAGFTLLGTLAAMFALGQAFRLPEPVVFTARTRLDMAPSRGALWAGLAVVAATVALYVVFW
ncbi:MAG: sodium/solute symporter [Kiritimatiellae bacterium]|nr:sodium/solute symporter [Kiritimatiellia bacterium]